MRAIDVEARKSPITTIEAATQAVEAARIRRKPKVFNK